MIEAGSLEYAHARLGARYGNRADEIVWRRLAMIRDFGTFLDTARASALGAWVTGIGPDANVHAVELAMRAHWRERVAALAAWMPPAWRAAIEWCELWADLPVLQHLARGGAAPSWLHCDPLHDILRDGTHARHESGAATLLAAGKAAPDRLASLWYEGWLQRLPGTESSLLREFIGVLKAHATRFREPLHPDGWALRRTLQARLAQMFRRATLDPAAAFIFLALSALEGERLRGELVRRAAFPNLQLAS